MIRPFALLGLILSLLWPCIALARPSVWVARDADSTILIFGSVHVLPSGLDWRPPELDAALARADDLWFEIPIDGAAQAEASRTSVALGMLPPGQTLSGVIPPELAARLAKLVARFGLYSPGLERMRPWLAELTLVLAMQNRLGAVADNGVEYALQASTPQTVKRRAFETPGDQIAILAGASFTDQIATLSDTMSDIEGDTYPLEEILTAWMAGDAAAMEAAAVTPLRQEFPRLYETLIVQRNQRWSRQLQTRLRGHGVTVVVVGAGHLVGPDSLPALLRAAGVTVEGP